MLPRGIGIIAPYGNNPPVLWEVLFVAHMILLYLQLAEKKRKLSMLEPKKNKDVRYLFWALPKHWFTVDFSKVNKGALVK